ncbi:MAG: hypothetical protein L3J83_03720 [Proteobacteria bacterium]|nr:hypothetical protein [Pseudomonadota bacterium]
MTVDENDVVKLDDVLDSAIENDNTEEVKEELTEQEVNQIEEIEAHDYFSKGQKAMFEFLGKTEGGRDHQQSMLDRFNRNQSQYSRVVNDAQQLRSRFEPINKVLEPYERDFNLNYGSQSAGLSNVLELWKYGQQDVVGLCKHLLQQKGKSFSDLEEMQEWDENPKVTELQAKYDNLERQFQQNNIQSQQMQEQQVENQRLAAIDMHRQTKDSEGNLKYPLFDQILPQILNLAQSEPMLGMDQAYSRITGELMKHFGTAQPTKTVVSKALGKTRAGKTNIKSKNQSSSAPSKSLDQILDDVMGSAAA